jgi:hypothetical protein
MCAYNQILKGGNSFYAREKRTNTTWENFRDQEEVEQKTAKPDVLCTLYCDIQPKNLNNNKIFKTS